MEYTTIASVILVIIIIGVLIGVSAYASNLNKQLSQNIETEKQTLLSAKADYDRTFAEYKKQAQSNFDLQVATNTSHEKQSLAVVNEEINMLKIQSSSAQEELSLSQTNLKKAQDDLIAAQTLLKSAQDDAVAKINKLKSDYDLQVTSLNTGISDAQKNLDSLKITDQQTIDTLKKNIADAQSQLSALQTSTTNQIKVLNDALQGKDTALTSSTTLVGNLTKSIRLALNSSVNGRYVKVAHSAVKVLSMSQLEVFTLDQTGNVALYKPTTQTSTLGIYNSRNAVDGNVTGFTHTLGTEIPVFTLDLGKTFNISHIRITSRLDCCQERIIGAAVSVIAADNTTIVWTSDPITDSQFIYDFFPPSSAIARSVLPPVNTSKFTRMMNTDIPGNDSQCFRKNTPLSMCENLCKMDPNCKGYVDIESGVAWPNESGCCIKNGVTTVVSKPGVHAYTLTDNIKTGPYPFEVLQDWWNDAGCENSDYLKNPGTTDWWNKQTSDGVKADMAYWSILPDDSHRKSCHGTAIRQRPPVTDLGYADTLKGPLKRGYYDYSNQGVANDYCRYVGTETAAYWCCQVAGTTYNTPATQSADLAKLPIFQSAPQV